MIFNYLIHMFFIIVRDFLDIFDIATIELIALPESILQVVHSFISTAFFFVPVSTLPIFVVVPLLWLAKIVVSVIDGILGVISRTPIIHHV